MFVNISEKPHGYVTTLMTFKKCLRIQEIVSLANWNWRDFALDGIANLKMTLSMIHPTCFSLDAKKYTKQSF